MNIKLDSVEAKNYAIKQLGDCAINAGLAMSISKATKDRTAAQNAFLWMLYTDMQNTSVNEHAGTLKDEWHELMKREYLVRIYERDDPAGYGEMINALRRMYRNGNKQDAELLHKHIVKETSTTKAKVPQFTEYLNCIMNWCNERGISYRMPGDLYNLAMGL